MLMLIVGEYLNLLSPDIVSNITASSFYKELTMNEFFDEIIKYRNILAYLPEYQQDVMQEKNASIVYYEHRIYILADLLQSSNASKFIKALLENPKLFLTENVHGNSIPSPCL